MEQRTAIVSLVGRPNAGKSTLLNALVGQKVSIVTPKVQTTRTRITGISLIEDTQIVYVDTPGIFKPQKTLDKAMVRAAWSGLKDVDFAVLVVDCKKGFDNETKMVIEGMNQRHERDGMKYILVLNKIDLVPKEKLLELASLLTKDDLFEQVFMVSATKNNGVKDIQKYIVDKAQLCPWPYAQDQITNISNRLFSAEITREKLMLGLEKELPYKLMVNTESWEEKPPARGTPNGRINIHQVVIVDSDSQKKIIVGKGGENIKKIGEASRKELSWIFDSKVSLFLHVKVQNNWQESAEHYEMQGLEI